MTTAIMEFTAAALRRIHTCFPFSLPRVKYSVGDGLAGANRFVVQRYEKKAKIHPAAAKLWQSMSGQGGYRP